MNGSYDIMESVNEWKLRYAVIEYCTGRMGFKKGWKFSGASFNTWLIALERSGLELEIPEILETRSEEISNTIDLKESLRNQ